MQKLYCLILFGVVLWTCFGVILKRVSHEPHEPICLVLKEFDANHTQDIGFGGIKVDESRYCNPL